MKRSFRKFRWRLGHSGALWMPLLAVGVVVVTLLIMQFLIR
ncbi:hypothetical protein [Deinococcus hopiensis]|nr:hypothetical protein [Deinococcus hopiensis]